MTVKDDDISGLAKLDYRRRARSGIPEAVLAEGKTLDQVIRITRQLAARIERALVTRLPAEWGERLREALTPELEVTLYADGRLAVAAKPASRVEPTGGVVGLLAAGTADIPVAEEVRVTATEMGCEVLAHYDVGVAGIHRLQQPLAEFVDRDVGIVVAVAGMEGALPTVVSGLVTASVIGVPTSVGYGFGGGGKGALMTMLQSCSPGLTVVNIDNGFGAGATAALYANRLARIAANTQGSKGDSDAI
ncbi:MAG: nickel pincer cofactor biosynthesis protein LarB [Deltaproteobacteria bacterium]|nr:nickel pincer cofactor biosynthesis protein LarB [Deltaproteobacteria bacterium]